MKPDELVIAPATDDERAWAAALMAGSEPWLTLGRNLAQCQVACTDRQRLLFVAHAGPTPCGFVLLHPAGVAGSPYLASIAVAEEFRGHGIGQRLLDFTEDYFRPSSRHLFLCVSSFNERARALYERRGYRLIGKLDDYVIDGASELLMHKRLSPPSSA
jgi:[ribosomal protein S18]-alanine N-acetyltransferase